MDLFTFAFAHLLALSTICSATEERCSAHSATDIDVSISSRRNQTGHWFITMDALTARPDAATANSSPGGVALDVSHGSASCGPAQYTRLSATAVYESVNRAGPTSTQEPVTAPELSAWTSSSTAETPAPPAGYEFRGGLGYYKFHTSALTWEKARDTCELEGGHLLVFNSEQEAEVVKELWGENLSNIKGARYTDELYVGVSDIAQEGRWETVLGGRLEDTGYVRWYGREPSGGTGENCAVVDVDSGVHFYSRPCSWLLAFICEWRPQQ